MKIKLMDMNPNMISEWGNFFKGTDVEIAQGNICEEVCDGIVSPANSFGFMDGGLDYYLSLRFGWGLQTEVQRQISQRPMRELLVGEAIIVPTNDGKIPYLIVAPTMRVPSRIRGTVNPYLAMKAILSEASRSGLNSIVCAGLGTGSGEVPVRIAALQMAKAYQEFINPPEYPKSFKESQQEHFKLI